MRYVTRESHDQILGDTVEVMDSLHRRRFSVYSGPYADQRANQRARELNAQDDAEKAQRQGHK